MALTSAASMSDYMEGSLLQWFGGTNMPTAPTTWYAGLLGVLPADAGTKASPQNGTELTTTNGTGGFTQYQRVSITAATGWTAIAAATGDSTGQMIQNNAALPASGTAWTNNGGSTVNVNAVGLWDASGVGTGNLWPYFPLQATQPIAAGSNFSLNVNQLAIYVD